MRDGAVERDLVFDERHGLAMDVYRPTDAAGGSPGVLLLHGGAFVRGDKATTSSIARVLAAVGYVAFSANYVLIPDAAPVRVGLERYWEAVAGVEGALRFAWERADRFGLDTSRMAAFGISAGGTFATMLGWRGVEGHRDRMPVRAVVSWSGALDMHRAAKLPTAENRSVPATVPHAWVVQVEEHREDLRLASPLSYLDGRSAPTMLVTTRDDFVPIDVAREAATRMSEVGVEHELLVRRRGHALAYARRTIVPTLLFLERHVGAGSGI